MLKYFIPFTLLFFAVNLSGQHCLTNGIRLDSQSQINLFAASYPGCSIIDGDVIINGQDINDLSGLAQIRHIRGKLILKYNPSLTSLAGLDSLYSVHKLYLLHNDVLTDMTGLGLLDSLGTLRIEANAHFKRFKGLDALTTIEELQVVDNPQLLDFKGMPKINPHLLNLSIVGNPMITTLIGLERLYEVDNLSIGKNDHLLSLKGLENLRFTQNSFTLFENGLSSLAGLDHYEGTEGFIVIKGNNFLESITGTPVLQTTDALLITDNSMLRDLAGLSHISTMRNLQIARNSHLGTLTGLDGLSSVSNNLDITDNKNLVDLNGLNQLSLVGTNLSIRQNEQLRTLSGLNGLSKVGDSFRIYGNPRLGTLSDLSALELVDGVLSIEFNPSLGSLDGLDNISAERLDQLFITGNIQLSICHVRSICDYLSLGKPAMIEGNAGGCLNVGEVMEKCDNNSIAGTVFFDINGNKIQDANEHGIPNATVRINPGNVILLTNMDGEYRYFGAVPGTEYRLSLELPAGMKITTDSAEYHILFDIGNPDNQNRDWGLFHIQPIHQLDITTAGAISRCGFVVPFLTTVTNSGSYSEAVCFEVNWDAEMSWAGSNPAPSSLDVMAHTARFCTDTLNPFEQFRVRYLLKMPGVQSRGDTLEIRTEAFYKDSSGYQSAATDTLKSPLLCAYDPNDKSVNPPGVRKEHYTLMKSPLRYLIHFQNVGDIAAENIRIEDALDPAMDLHSLKVLSASHPYRLEMDERGGVVFYFDGIQLPDSTTDARRSQGFIQYEIVPRQDIADFTVVHNTAHIYFDYNPPITTGTTINTLVHQIPIITGTQETVTKGVKIYPVPTNERLVLEMGEDCKMPVHLIISSIDGQTMLDRYINAKVSEFNTRRWPAGSYFIKTISGKGELRISRFVIEH